MTLTYRRKQQQIINRHKWRADSRAPAVSRVPIQANYAADPALCLTSVVFIPPEIGDTIYRALVEPLQAAAPQHYYYRPEAMHLTIKNIRRIHHPPRFSPDDIRTVNQVFQGVLARHTPFTISLEETAPFATSVVLVGYSDERLGRLVQALDSGLTAAGLPDDKQYISDTVFFGNVTLCRYVQPPSAAFLAQVEALAHRFCCPLPVEQVHLISCNAVCAPALRTVWHTYRLGNK